MPPRPSMGRKEKKPRVGQDDDDSDEENHPPPQLHLVAAEHRFQPVDSDQAQARIRTILTELSTFKKDLDKAFPVLADAAADVAECSATDAPPDEGDIPADSGVIKQLDKEVRAVIDKLNEVEIRRHALSDLRQVLAQGTHVRNVVKRYEDDVKAPLAAYAARTSRQKYMAHEQYVFFRKLIWEVMYNGSAVPEMSKLIPREDGDEEDDDELEIQPQHEDFKCPLTLTILKDPYSSSKCKHHFSKLGILEHLKNGSAECPITGCHALLSRDDVAEDAGLKKRVEAFVRRQREEGTAARNATQFESISDSDDDE